LKPPGLKVLTELKTGSKEVSDAVSTSPTVSPALFLFNRSGSVAASVPVIKEPTAMFSLMRKEQGLDVIDGALFTWRTETTTLETDVKAVVPGNPES
jgi:hypothetical protein